MIKQKPPATVKRQEKIEKRIKEFEKQNPELAKSLDLFDMSMHEYERIVHTLNPVRTFTSNSTIALTNATLPYIIKLADKGLSSLKEDAGFGKGINTHKGCITFKPVAEVLGMMHNYKDLKELI